MPERVPVYSYQDFLIKVTYLSCCFPSRAFILSSKINKYRSCSISRCSCYLLRPPSPFDIAAAYFRTTGHRTSPPFPKQCPQFRLSPTATWNSLKKRHRRSPMLLAHRSLPRQDTSQSHHNMLTSSRPSNATTTLLLLTGIPEMLHQLLECRPWIDS